LAALRAGEIVAGHLYVSKAFQRARAAVFAQARAPANLRAAIVTHVYYPELWEEMFAIRDFLPAGSPIIVTAPPTQAQTLRMLVGSDPLVTILETPNRGRDIAPFLMALELGLLDQFDAVLKIHSKKSPHLWQGGLRRRVFLTALAGSRNVVARTLAQFADSKVGLVGPSAFFRRAPVYWMGNRDRVVDLAHRMGADATLGFFEGSMFWVRPAALAPLRGLRLRTEDFEEEIGQLDGTLHHAVERLFPVAAAVAGYETRSIGARILMPSAAAARTQS
jgi:lipopolysaccharide biosynthesis protein